MPFKSHSANSRSFILGSMSVLSTFIIILGVSLCLIQSPQKRAHSYLDIADSYTQALQEFSLSTADEQALLTHIENLMYKASVITPYHDDVSKRLLAMQENLTMTSFKKEDPLKLTYMSEISFTADAR
mgnify:CR=1 FL=1